MATKDELKAEILAIAANAVVEDLNHEQLSDLLKNLKEDPDFLKGDGDSEQNADAEKAAREAEEKAAADKAKKPPYSVAQGKAITTKSGVKSDGDEIKAKDLAGGQEAINGFVKSGHIVKN